MLELLQLDGLNPQIRATSFAAGVLLHAFVFRVGEWDLAALKLIVCFVLSFSATILIITNDVHPMVPHAEELGPAVWLTSMLYSYLLTGLYTSMALYRGFFHRLRKFPGPFLARFSGIYMTIRGTRTMQTFKEIQKLHAAYGDVVRVGPQELSITRPSAVQAMHVTSAPVDKGPFYSMTAPFISLQTIRTKTSHAPVRKVWDRGFSAKSLRDYEPRVARYTEMLLNQMEARVGTPINMTGWISFYGFDVMGDLAFGQSFDMLKTGTVNYYIGLMQDFLKVRAVFARIPWAFRILQVTMVLNASFTKFRTWMEQQVRQRMKNEPEIPDVFSWILADYQARPTKTQQDFFNLMGECTLITIAGSDTTSSSLTCLLFELARHPEVYKKLQAEIDQCFKEHGNNIPGHYELSKLEYLQACIDEALRLYPPLPGGVQRITPPEGLQVDNDFFIPGNTIVQIPLYTMYRDEKIFKHAEEFIPERWTTRRDLVTDAACFTPFLIGSFSCVGKQLALMEMRYVISRLAVKYNINLAKGQTPEAFTENNFDTFTIRLAPLQMTLQHRAKGKTAKVKA
ncbi:cytochrome p450 monooxygenase [Jackrogersella minutella]|nr:cytochrome p450 monooxygenase [Jackrogersella minutella]